MEKVTKNNITIISKPYAHPHTMKKTPAKFQKDQYKTVRGVSPYKTPRVTVDRQMDGNLRIQVGYTNAGATKKNS